MFELINEAKRSPDDRKVFLTKLAVFVAVMTAVGGIAYLIVMSMH